jgi:hypothetical protein
MQYILLALVYFGEFIHFSCAEGVGTTEERRLLPYLQRKVCKGFLCIITRVFVVEEAGFQSRDHSL